MNKKVTCLIPFFNENERIIRVVKVMKNVALIDEIVVVDDGSTDKASRMIKEQFPNVKLIILPQNRGKAYAIKKGLEYIKTQYVFLSDADLDNLVIEEIEVGIKTILNDSSLGMVILKRIEPNKNFPIISKIRFFERISCIFGGERILLTKDLRTIMNNKITNYQIEVAINQFMINHRKKVVWTKSSAHNYYRKVNSGLLGIWYKYLKMTKEIIDYVGLKKLIFQLRNFCLQENRYKKLEM